MAAPIHLTSSYDVLLNNRTMLASTSIYLTAALIEQPLNFGPANIRLHINSNTECLPLCPSEFWHLALKIQLCISGPFQYELESHKTSF
jgi:hypothetical protein